MHGVTKAQMQKIQKSKETEKTTQLFLSLKKQYSEKTLSYSEKFKINTEILMIASQDYQYWNDRKYLITEMTKNLNDQIENIRNEMKQKEDQNESINEDEKTHQNEEIMKLEKQREELLKGEMNITQKLLPLNSKAYVVWYHRKWTMNLLKEKNYQKERELCALMLKYDSRNCLFSFLFSLFLSFLSLVSL